MTDVQNNVPAIEAEETNAAEFSDYDSYLSSETTSLNSSIHHFVEQHGRRYHTYYGEDKNLMPNDDAEQDRLDAVHEGFVMIAGDKLCQAPVIKNPEVQRVLDLGTGTGIWAIDFACQNPHAEVIGMDLSPIQPSFVPPNCKFETDDFELDWTYKKPFQFIHARTISQSVHDWPRLMKQAYENLSPGGWMEVLEFDLIPKCDDGSMPADWPPIVMFQHVNRALRAAGQNIFPNSTELQGYLQDAGFTDIRTKRIKTPSGTWPKDPKLKQVGAFTVHSGMTGYEAYGLACLTRVLKMPEDGVIALCKKAAQAHLDRRVHAYFMIHIAYGRKPLDGEN